MWSWDDILEERNKHLSRFSNFIVFDIETIPDKQMLEEIGNDGEKEKHQNGEFLPIPFHKIVSISYLIIKNGDIKIFKSFVSEKEQFLINNFWDGFRQAYTGRNGYIEIFPVLITINGKDFDIPVINARSLRYIENIDETYKKYISIFLDKFDKWEDKYPRYTNRYTLYHIDIPLDIFGKKMSLKNLCYLCNIPVKQEGDGSKVEDYFNNGDLEKIARYCSEDVKATAMLFSYINEHFLSSMYPFPSIDDIQDFEPEIIKD